MEQHPDGSNVSSVDVGPWAVVVQVKELQPVLDVGELVQVDAHCGRACRLGSRTQADHKIAAPQS